MMKQAPYILLIFIFSFTSCGGSPAGGPRREAEQPDYYAYQHGEAQELAPIPFHIPGDNLPISTFTEVWGYVVQGREQFLTADMPLTDIAYFAAEVNMFGRLVGIPNRNALPAHPARVHLVAVCWGRALSHFVLLPGRPEREALIRDLVEAARDFDGLQINFEEVPNQSRESYFSFLRELRERLPAETMFTVALAARTRRLQNDAYDYETILPYVDRILVMAYDEHWGGGSPGPVASLPWSRNVANFSLGVIGADRLIMGMPFYGRAWVNQNHARALIFDGVENVIREHNVTEIRRSHGVPNFTYDVTVTVTLYYNDAYSLTSFMQMYKSMGVTKVGFWRIGQETRDVWNFIRLAE